MLFRSIRSSSYPVLFWSNTSKRDPPLSRASEAGHGLPPPPADPGPPRPTLDPPFGVQSDSIDFPKPPLDASWVAERVFGRLSFPSKHRLKRKLKMLKFAQYFPQLLRPSELLLIQDPPKSPPLDRIHSTKGRLVPRRGAKNTSWDPFWTLLESTSKKNTFFTLISRAL